MVARVRLGELLVEAQIITREQLEEMLELQKTDGRRLGTLLVEAGIVTETQVTQILSQQLSVPWVSLYHIDFSRQLLNLVPRETAERHCLVPIFVRRVRGQGETLYLAMDNPEDETAKSEVSKYSGLPVRAMIAPPNDIRGAIRAYYGGGRDDAPAPPESLGDEPPTTRVVVREETATPTPSAPEHSGPSIEIHSEKLVERAHPVAASLLEQAPPKPDTLPPDSGSNISARDVAIPRPKRGKRGRMITVTLLDGTQVNLPARRRPRGTEPPGHTHSDEFTARDLVAALRAISHGADASEILGENVKWEKLFAALLSVLLKKHLIADWEFVDEYRKI